MKESLSILHFGFEAGRPGSLPVSVRPVYTAEY